ncbi:MAG: hypothetical protein VXX82_03140 [Verrucomicrobiota bacterium]|nr:hypothetical protein [Verrucomicrobiota bacterium]
MIHFSTSAKLAPVHLSLGTTLWIYVLIAFNNHLYSEIVLSEALSVEGYLDVCAEYNDLNQSAPSSGHSSLNADELSLSFIVKPGSIVSGQLDIAYDGTDGSQGMQLDQALAVIRLEHGELTIGQYASMLGFEAFDPTGLYQSTTAYNLGFIGDFSVLNQYAYGVKYSYMTAVNFFGISLQKGAADIDANPLHKPYENTDSMVEVATAQDWGAGLTSFLGGAYCKDDGGNRSSYSINAYITYENQAWVFAAELNRYNSKVGSQLGEHINQSVLVPFTAGKENVLQWLLMANYTYSDRASITARVSRSKHESDLLNTDEGIRADFIKFTAAHRQELTDNLTIISELSLIEADSPFAGFLVGGVQGTAHILFTF